MRPMQMRLELLLMLLQRVYPVRRGGSPALRLLQIWSWPWSSFSINAALSLHRPRPLRGQQGRKCNGRCRVFYHLCQSFGHQNVGLVALSRRSALFIGFAASHALFLALSLCLLLPSLICLCKCLPRQSVLFIDFWLFLP